MKLKEQEESYSKELKEWKAQLKPRKQVGTDTNTIDCLLHAVFPCTFNSMNCTEL